MTEKKLRIIITGGGTGDHFFPGIALATALQKNTGDIFLEIHTEKKEIWHSR